MLTQKRLKELLHYNKETGIWRWRVGRSGTSGGRGSKAGSLQHGYLHIVINYKTFRSARLAFLYMEGYLPENNIDHINRIRDDDRWDNLRETSQTCNMRNIGMLKNNTSGAKGVHWCKTSNKWISRIRNGGKSQKTIGRFDDFVEAAATRFAVEQCLNYQNCDANSTSGKVLKEYLEIIKP